MVIDKPVNPRFESFIWDWDYETYLLLGGYGSSKSYHIAFKLILKCFQEKRKVLVIREVYDTIRDSCFDLFTEILEELDLLYTGNARYSKHKVVSKTSPMQLSFPNGSKIIFKGMDKPAKLKSINGVSIVWFEEASETKYAGYKEVLGRLRHPTLDMHFILSWNPVGRENWTYKHFFRFRDDKGVEHIILDDKELYKRHTIIKNGIYYHHSTCDDNYFLPAAYIKRLNEIKSYDPDLYRVARLGRYGINGLRVLPQFTVAESHEEVMSAVDSIPEMHKFVGMDFGFEVSFNAVVRMAVDDETKTLYLYDEYYKNKQTDVETADDLAALGYMDKLITADCAEPKTIRFYQLSGFKMRGCRKFAGSRLLNTKKVKRFKKIVCSPSCENCIRELSELTYAKDDKDELIYDEFNIDPHTFSAIWYGLDNYYVADIKERKSNSRKGA